MMSETSAEIHLVAGSYQHMLFGYNVQLELDATGIVLCEAEPVKQFSVEAHAACMTCIAASGNTFTTGSSDELIKYA